MTKQYILGDVEIDLTRIWADSEIKDDDIRYHGSSHRFYVLEEVNGDLSLHIGIVEGMQSTSDLMLARNTIPEKALAAGHIELTRLEGMIANLYFLSDEWGQVLAERPLPWYPALRFGEKLRAPFEVLGVEFLDVFSVPAAHLSNINFYWEEKDLGNGDVTKPKLAAIVGGKA